MYTFIDTNVSCSYISWLMAVGWLEFTDHYFCFSTLNISSPFCYHLSP